MWKKFSNTMVRSRSADYVARIYEDPWKKVAGKGELLKMVRDYNRTVKDAVARGNKEAASLGKRHLVLGLQETGVGVLAQMVRFKEFGIYTEAFETTERWTVTAAKNSRMKEVDVMVTGTGGRCFTCGMRGMSGESVLRGPEEKENMDCGLTSKKVIGKVAVGKETRKVTMGGVGASGAK